MYTRGMLKHRKLDVEETKKRVQYVNAVVL